MPVASERLDFPILGVGVLAGGIDACGRMLAALPPDLGAAVVIVQPLAPKHDSHLAENLAQQSALPVVQVVEGTDLLPGQVHVIPPGRFLRLSERRLAAEEPVPDGGERHPIDHFFRSLASGLGDRAIAVVLSGTGSDGSEGLGAVRAAGGLTIVQTPKDAERDGMPRAAIATGHVDLVLPVADIGAAILDHLNRTDRLPPEADAATGTLPPDGIRAVLRLLREQTDYDFTGYKRGTVERRIRRRMGLRRIARLDEYVAVLSEAPDEVNQLFRDLLIGVTRFFREPNAWAAFDALALAPLVEAKAPGATIRAWVPGCATGEEAYTLAMVLFDRLDRLGLSPEVQIFATDLNDIAIARARVGRYPRSAASDLPEATLQKYFLVEGDGLRVGKRLREAVVFATQNVVSDPPFSKLDIITCRNLMIYLEGDAQRRMIDLFHFALAEKGVLFLGSSESVNRPGHLFETLDKSARVFRRSDTPQPAGGGPPVMQMERRRTRTPAQPEQIRASTATDLARRLLLDRFAPAAVLVDRNLDVQFFHGPVRDYLDFPDGEPSSNLLEMTTDRIRATLRNLLSSLGSDRRGASTAVEGVPRGDGEVAVRITAERVAGFRDDGETILVAFEDLPPTAASAGAPDDGTPAGSADRALVVALEDELRATRDDLQSTIEEMETSNEELTSSNEEVMSMNEELQSSNEELQTSREELQSLNEELSTVNSQLEEKVREVEATSSDLANLLTSTNIAVIFLDSDLVIRRFTPAIRDIMRIIDSDIGRSVEDISMRVQDLTLIDDARVCLSRLTETEAEVQTEAGHHLIRRLRPYRTSDNRIGGVVVTYTDMTTLYRARDRARQRERQQESVAELGRMALADEPLERLLDVALTELSRHLCARFVKVLELEPDGRSLIMRAGRGWRDGAVGTARFAAGAMSQAGYSLMRTAPVVVENFAEERRFTAAPLFREHGIVAGASLIIGPLDAPWGVLGAHESELGRCSFSVDDLNYMQSTANVLWLAISGRRAKAAIEADRTELRALTDALPMHFAIIDKDYRYSFVNRRYEMFGRRREEIEGLPLSATYSPADFEELRPHLEAAKAGEARTFEFGGRPFGQGHQPVYLVNLVPRVTEGGAIDGIYSAGLDITQQKQLERDIIERTEQYRLIGESIPYGVWIADVDGGMTYLSDSFLQMVGMTYAEAAGKGWTRALAKGTAAQAIERWDTCRRSGADWESEHRFVGPNGTQRHVLALGRPVRDEAGEIVSWVGLNLDITDRKSEEDRLALISAELDHRVKNILAMVSTIARMTGRRANSLAEYRSSLEERLQAMANAHQVLADEHWKGMDLATLLSIELAPYVGRSELGVALDGPPAMLAPTTAQSLALAIHELTANAARYGALSVDGGKVAVSWTRAEGGRLRLVWDESGLDAVTAPANTGFGTTVLQRVLSLQVGAEVAMDWRPEGLRVIIGLPADAVGPTGDNDKRG